MKKIIFLYIIFLSIACESLGVNEFTEEMSYYEYVGYGWTNFYQRNYFVALDYFDTAIQINEVEYTNSANVGKAWTYLMMANESLGSSLLESRRDSANFYFNKSSENSLEASELYNECDYEFCCNDCFIKDCEVGKIYSDVSRYLNYEQDALTYENLVINISTFLQDNSDENFYDFNNGKPNTGSFNLDSNSIVYLLAQLHFLNEDIYNSCLILEQNEVCELSEECLQNNISNDLIESLLNCLSSFTPIQ